MGRKRKFFVGFTTEYKEIIADAGMNQWSHPVYLYKCLKCGKIGGPKTGHKIALYNSSRCCGWKNGNNAHEYFGYEEITGAKIAHMKYDAKRRNLLFDVTAQYLWEIWIAQKGKCRYSGLALTHGIDASVDRIDSAEGYVIGNVQWVHRDINYMKRAFPEEYFLSLCKLVAANAGTHTISSIKN